MFNQTFPKELIEFVAKTGFITKETWVKYFFAGRKPRWTHQAWADLARRGYLMPHPYPRIENIYVLNRLNRLVRDFVHGQAARPPAVPQIDHDEILNHGLLRAERSELISQWISEPELKAMGGREHQIKRAGRITKYPDAIVYLPRTIGDMPIAGDKPIAIELELTLKSRRRYRQIMAAYGCMNHIRAVLFVTKAPVIERAIKENVIKTYFPTDQIKLGFMRLADWQGNLSEAAIEIDGKRQSWADFSGVHSFRTEGTAAA